MQQRCAVAAPKGGSPSKRPNDEGYLSRFARLFESFWRVENKKKNKEYVGFFTEVLDYLSGFWTILGEGFKGDNGGDIEVC